MPVSVNQLLEQQPSPEDQENIAECIRQLAGANERVVTILLDTLGGVHKSVLSTLTQQLSGVAKVYADTLAQSLREMSKGYQGAVYDIAPPLLYEPPQIRYVYVPVPTPVFIYPDDYIPSLN